MRKKQKSIFLICPTDCLEQRINESFESENFFYTSLGNSFVYDYKTIYYIKQMIKNHAIDNIFFVLSINNKIVLDALNNHKFAKIGALQTFYNDIEKQQKQSIFVSQNYQQQFTLLSYYLNQKIKEIASEFSDLSLKINGKIYDSNQNLFTAIYSDLVCLEKHRLN